MASLRMKSIIAWLLAALFLCQQVAAPVAHAQTRPSLNELVNKSYIELLGLAGSLNVPIKEIEEFKRQLDRDEQAERQRLKNEAQKLKQEAEQLRRQLSELNKRASRDTEEMTAERRNLHCRILRLEREMRNKDTERDHGVPVAYDNKRAKLDLLQQWPARQKEIQQTIASGRARDRRYGDVEDIGIRKLGEGQEKDVKIGEDAIREMKAYGLIPPEVEDKELKGYIQGLANDIAAHSDLKVPLKVTVLDSEEINALALPGGFLFVNTGLIEKAETESELVGVLAHEIAHVAARHGARLMKRATIASLIYQAAQIAAIIFTGGVASIGVYYALQYGFFGLGMVINLALLGVSREYEAEADQLGAQYAWAAGYDPKGFITFFDKMASEKGYVRSASFFRTHPPFFDRIVSTFSEIAYLPQKENLKVDRTEFHQAKERLKKVMEERQEEKKKRPTLRRLPECGDEQEKPAGDDRNASTLATIQPRGNS